MQKLHTQIALTHLTSRMKQTVISALGVTFGIGFFISMISFMTGVNEFTNDLTLDNTAHIRLYDDIKKEEKQAVDFLQEFEDAFKIVRNVKPKKDGQEIRNARQIINILENDNRVEAVSPRVNSQAFYSSGATVLNGTVLGVDIIEEDKLFNVSEKVIEGSMDGLLTQRNSLILGSGLAEKLSVEVNDRITITSAEGARYFMKVVGIFKSGLSQIDNTQSYATVSTAQKLLQESNDYITNININLKDIDWSAKVAKEYSKRFDIEAEDFDTANAQFQVGNILRNIITYAISITLLLVAGFGIYNILTMMIYEKMDDIAILKATGLNGKDVKIIFLLEALFIGLVGGIAGLIMGLVVSFGISKIPFETDEFISMDYLPVNFDPLYYVIGILFALASTFLAGYLPAKRAANIDPVEIIRGN